MISDSTVTFFVAPAIAPIRSLAGDVATLVTDCTPPINSLKLIGFGRGLGGGSGLGGGMLLKALSMSLKKLSLNI